MATFFWLCPTCLYFSLWSNSALHASVSLIEGCVCLAHKLRRSICASLKFWNRCTKGKCHVNYYSILGIFSSVVSHFEPRLLKLPRFTPKAQILRKCLHLSTRSQFSSWCCLPASLQCIERKWRQDAGETSFQASDHVTSLCFIHFIRAFPPTSFILSSEDVMFRDLPCAQMTLRQDQGYWHVWE